MFFAVIGDIESNFSGLEAVLDVLRQEGIQRVLHTGNVCGEAAGARECLALLRERGVVCVQGKRDRALARSIRSKARGAVDPERDRAYAALGSLAVEHLYQLPRKRSFSEEGIRIVLCHGAVNSAGEILSADTPMNRFRRERETVSADIIVCGGAAQPFSFLVDQTLFVCPGPMRNSAGHLCYTVVDTESAPWSATSHTLEAGTG